ncbi:MAG: hypothetical protein K8U57_09840 [Planctomycetes bacterium]|nr:hypothetical protein [Planctomycetota bacterium]
MSITAAPSESTNPLPFLAALGLAVVGFFVVVNVADVLGYGKDTHTLRVLSLTLPLFVGGAVAFWPGSSVVVRVGVLAVTIGVAVAAWVYTPSSGGGMSLAQAVAKRNEVLAEITTAPSYQDVTRAEGIGTRLASLAAFPSLIETVQPDVNEWGNAAAERLAEQYRSVSPDNVSSLDELTKRAHLLTKYIPQTREAVATAERTFSNRSADFWVSELNRVPAGDFIKFRAWGSRRDSVKSILPNPTRIVEAENAWVSSAVEAAITRSELIQKFMPQRARDALLTTAMEIRNLPEGGGSETKPFRAARQRLFAVALERAQGEAQSLAEQSAYDRAFDVAKTHATGWALDAVALGPDATTNLAHFRDGYGFLATLAEKVGVGPDFVPPPRTKP